MRGAGLVCGRKRDLNSTPVILAWKIPWTRSLVGYSPQACNESDTTEATEHTAHKLHLEKNWGAPEGLKQGVSESRFTQL